MKKAWWRNSHNTLQGEVNSNMSEAGFKLFSLFQRNEADLFKGIHFEGQMYRNREEYLICHLNKKVKIQEYAQTFRK